jgi:hypothetical protein
VTDLFGYYNFGSAQSSKGSTYGELIGSFDLGSGFTLAPHIGYQEVEHIANAKQRYPTPFSVTMLQLGCADRSGLDAWVSS